jgi:hypothetical protein
MGCLMRIKFQRKRIRLRVSLNRQRRLKKKLKKRLIKLSNRKYKGLLYKKRFNIIPRRNR